MESEYGEDYELVWRRKGVRIGEVRNHVKDRAAYRRIRIVKDDAEMNEVKMRFLVSIRRQGEPYILVSSDFLNLSETHQVAAIWHEVGHVHHEHYELLLSLGLQNQNELAQRRREYTKRNEAVPEEVEADAFAVKQVGNLIVVDFLKYLMDTRPVGASGGINDLGRQELALRIALIENRPHMSTHAGPITL